jgi:hypothetical protein
MRLCNFTVKIDIPDDFTIQKQDRALDVVDEIDLPMLIEAFVRERLRKTSGLRYATATVES